MNRYALSIRQALTGVFVLLTMASPLHAGIIIAVTADVESAPGGLFSYQYTLANSPASDLSATDFSLDVSSQANLTSINPPAGWTVAYNTGDNSFYAFSPGPATDITPGETEMLSFLSPLAPDAQTYSIFGLNPVTFDFDTATGTVPSPTNPASVTPEPATLTLLAIGIAGIAGYGWRRRKCNR